jgi:3-isopropylmalate/(R)-2-methylmalate dehydratase small subunit
VILKGNVWRLGDNVDTDQILPARYINITDIKERATHCFENFHARFASSVEAGDIVVAGDNFGCGSSRPSVEILQDLSLGGVVARSFSRIFFRGGIARGFPLVTCPKLNESDFPEGHMIRVDIKKGLIVDQTIDKRLPVEIYPSFLREIITAGGLMNYTRNRCIS